MRSELDRGAPSLGLPRDVSQPAISVIVVLFNSGDTVEHTVRSIPSSAELVLVDQQSTDDGVARSLKVRPDARVVRAGNNRGFGAGCNLGAANASGDVLIFLNPDAGFVADSAEQLAKCAAARGALVGPTIRDGGGGIATRVRRWSSPASDLAEVALPRWLTPAQLERDVPTGHRIYTEGGAVDYVQGSCMAVPRDLFWAAGGFDERYFLYHEEEVLARRLKLLGSETVLLPRAEIMHVGATSTDKVREFAAKQYYRSRALYYRDDYSRGRGCVAILALWLVLQLMAVSWPLRRRIGHRDSRDGGWHRAAARGVVAGAMRQMETPPSVPGIHSTVS